MVNNVKRGFSIKEDKVVERQSPELHTDVVRVRASARTEDISVWMMHLSVHMYVVWLSPGGSGGFTGIFRDAEICPGFPPPQAALVIATSGEKGLWVE